MASLLWNVWEAFVMAASVAGVPDGDGDGRNMGGGGDADLCGAGEADC
jgi:hypothetical protein